MEALTMTFGDVAENHARMQKIGQLADFGFDLNDLNQCKQFFESKGNIVQLIDLKQRLLDIDQTINPNLIEPAYLLIVKDAINTMFINYELADNLIYDEMVEMGLNANYDFIFNGYVPNVDDLYEELLSLDYDKKALMYGRVVNKTARYNLCFSDIAQEPSYSEGKGRIVSFDSVELLNKIRQSFGSIIGPKGANLKAEANYYYDITKCGIGYHGDSERKKVIGLRFGHTIPLYYQWYFKSEQIGPKMVFDNIQHGDLYIMSEKTTGNDWKKKNIYTLRHAAGSDKFTQ